MASRFFIDQNWTLLKGLVTVRARILMSGTTPVLQAWSYPSVQSGATGSYVTAGTSSSPQGGMGTAGKGAEGVKSVTRTNTGLWTIVLQDNYQRLVDLSCYQSLSGGASTILAIGEDTSISSMTSAGGSTIGVALLSATANAADPADGKSITIKMVLQNSTAP